jgi:hypothetical protein
MERSGQMLFWTAIGSLAAVAAAVTGVAQCSGRGASTVISSPPGTPTTTASPSPSARTGSAIASGSAASGSPGIYHQGTLTLAFNTGVDLDAHPVIHSGARLQPTSKVAAPTSGRSTSNCQGGTVPKSSLLIRELTPPARMQRVGSPQVSTTFISALGVSSVSIPIKIAIRCCVSRLLIPLLTQ